MNFKSNKFFCQFHQINSIRSKIDELMSRKCFRKYSEEKRVAIMDQLQQDLIGFEFFSISFDFK